MNDINVWLHVDGATENAREARQPSKKAISPERRAETTKSAALTIGTYIAGGVLKSAASRIGTVTGSQNTQNAVNFGINSAVFVGALAVNPAMAIAVKSLQLAQTAFDYAWKMNIDNREKERTATRKEYVNSGGR